MQGGSAALDFFEDVRSLGRPDKRLGLWRTILACTRAVNPNTFHLAE